MWFDVVVVVGRGWVGRGYKLRAGFWAVLASVELVNTRKNDGGPSLRNFIF